jgi:hypothetical protein
MSIKSHQQAASQAELRETLRRHEEALMTVSAFKLLNRIGSCLANFQARFSQQASEADQQSRTTYSLEAVYTMLSK